MAETFYEGNTETTGVTLSLTFGKDGKFLLMKWHARLGLKDGGGNLTETLQQFVRRCMSELSVNDRHNVIGTQDDQEHLDALATLQTDRDAESAGLESTTATELTNVLGGA